MGSGWDGQSLYQQHAGNRKFFWQDEQLQLLSFLWLETLFIPCLHLQSDWILNKDIMIMTLYVPKNITLKCTREKFKNPQSW